MGKYGTDEYSPEFIRQNMGACDHQLISKGGSMIINGLNARKPIFGVSDSVVFKLACSATKTS